ncbi:acsF [Gossypium arboreum]|uniref:AcsF n=1 Tax=Gossypium arboreum TaxID=29729 RepID=A0A0B0MG54_GOSAR|nr:acsF [Gossypium arboreum]
MLPINYESWHLMPDSNKNQALDNIKELSSSQKFGYLQLFDIAHREKDGSPMTSEAGEIMEKLKDKKAEYEAIASSDSSVNLKNIDNIIITEVLDPKRYGRMAQMQESIGEQITQLKAEAASLKDEAAAREVEQNRKYNELQLQLQNMIQMFQQSQKPPS